jgi:hypothetical protein
VSETVSNCHGNRHLGMQREGRFEPAEALGVFLVLVRDFQLQPDF